MHFIDEARISVGGGHGGAGAIAFRRESFVALGGPAGGDGGKGGDVIFVADTNVNTLLEFRFRPKWEAKNGEPGGGRDCNGRNAEDVVLRVPVGTLVLDAESGETLADLDAKEKQFIAAKGGRGGLGNMNFATPWDQAPRRAQPGEAGEARVVRLSLKLLADVGIIGFPNVGKSTFISVVSRARPKIADYPFTTLVPNLGVVRVDENKSFVVADIPGLIPGASDGAGLGVRFLKHVERTRALLHLIAPDPDRTVDEDYDTIMKELRAFSPELARRPTIVALTKADLPEARESYARLKPVFAKRGIDLRLISPVTGEGVREMVFALDRLLRGESEPVDESVVAEPVGVVVAKRAPVAKPAKKKTKPITKIVKAKAKPAKAKAAKARPITKSVMANTAKAKPVAKSVKAKTPKAKPITKSAKAKTPKAKPLAKKAKAKPTRAKTKPAARRR